MAKGDSVSPRHLTVGLLVKRLGPGSNQELIVTGNFLDNSAQWAPTEGAGLLGMVSFSDGSVLYYDSTALDPYNLFIDLGNSPLI